ncbi:unnamed protein product [Auanema sp. JU1783]|nr:unnamed protein product [Auanema sp. JU1783]
MLTDILFLAFICCLSVASAEENFEDSRCRCLCPSTAYFVRENSSNPDNHRRFYTKTNVNPGFCNPQNVVKPEVIDDVVDTHIDAFLANCNCKYESRNSVMLKVVVNFIIVVIFVLVAYMAYLVCLEPIFKKKRHDVPYRHQNDDMEDNIFARVSANSAGSSESPEVTNARSRNSIPNVLDRVEAEQNRWKRQVEVQRRNIFEDHTMLN